MFATTGTYYEVGNLGNASRFRSLASELENLVNREQQAQVAEYSEEKNADVSVAVAKGGLKHAKKYVVPKKEPFERCLAMIRRKAKNAAAVLVLDNLESIFETTDLMNELADLIILLDDPRYAAYHVKMLIVGIPHKIRDYFSKTKSRAPVANRLQELPEVSRLTDREATALIYRGFIEELRYAFGPNARQEITYHVP